LFLKSGITVNTPYWYGSIKRLGCSKERREKKERIRKRTNVPKKLNEQPKYSPKFLSSR